MYLAPHVGAKQKQKDQGTTLLLQWMTGNYKKYFFIKKADARWGVFWHRIILWQLNFGKVSKFVEQIALFC